MTTFQELLNQPLGIVVPVTDGQAIRFPPQPETAFQLDPEWEERLRPVPESMRPKCAADFMIYVRVGQLPDDADLTDYSPTGINLNP
jgi:hypothetical protein